MQAVASDSLQFVISPNFTVTVEVIDYKPVDDRGRRCDCLWLRLDRKILVFSGLDPEDRVDGVLHEIGHAWDDYRRTDHADPEARTDDRAIFTRWFWGELQRQGGEDAIRDMRSPMQRVLEQCAKPAPVDLEYEPVEDDASVRWPVQPSHFPTQCGHCGQTISPGCIHDEQTVERDEKLIKRQAFVCPTCDRMFGWEIEVDADGYPVPDSQPYGHQQVTDPQRVQAFQERWPVGCW